MIKGMNKIFRTKGTSIARPCFLVVTISCAVPELKKPDEEDDDGEVKLLENKVEPEEKVIRVKSPAMLKSS